MPGGPSFPTALELAFTGGLANQRTNWRIPFTFTHSHSHFADLYNLQFLETVATIMSLEIFVIIIIIY